MSIVTMGNTLPSRDELEKYDTKTLESKILLILKKDNRDLLDHGLEILNKKKGGITPTIQQQIYLHFYDDFKQIEYLLKNNKYDVNIVLNDGFRSTLLSVAINNSAPLSYVKFLVEYGSDINAIIDAEGYMDGYVFYWNGLEIKTKNSSIFDNAVDMGKDEKICKYLRDAGAKRLSELILDSKVSI